VLKIKCIDLFDTDVDVTFSESLHTLELGVNRMKKLPPFVRNLKKLVTLHVLASQIKEFPKELYTMTTLNSLKLVSDDLITNFGGGDFSRMTLLKELILLMFYDRVGSAMKVGFNSQFVLKLPPQLEKISTNVATFVESLADSSKMSSLESIGMDSVDERQLPKLTNFLSSFTLVTKIKSISVGFMPESHFDELLLVLNRCQNLQELTIENCWDISQKSLEELLVTLQSMAHLKKLHLRGFIETVFKTFHFQSLSRLPSLEDLSLGFLFDFKDESCDLSPLKSLKSLNLAYLNSYGSEIYLPKGLNSIAKTLELLTLVNCSLNHFCNVDELYSLNNLKYFKALHFPIPLNDEQIQAKFPKLGYFSDKKY